MLKEMRNHNFYTKILAADHTKPNKLKRRLEAVHSVFDKTSELLHRKPNDFNKQKKYL
jgi:hypothetical protein